MYYTFVYYNRIQYQPARGRRDLGAPQRCRRRGVDGGLGHPVSFTSMCIIIAIIITLLILVYYGYYYYHDCDSYYYIVLLLLSRAQARHHAELRRTLLSYLSAERCSGGTTCIRDPPVHGMY